jgi:transcriptional regulator NrdR family protein
MTIKLEGEGFMEPGLRCPQCRSIDCGKVIETIKVDEGVRRRYRCKVCEKIFPSYEYVGVKQLLVDKRGDRPAELFKRDKVKEGIELAYAKLGVSDAYVEGLTDRACERIHATGKRLISSEEIGRIVLDELLHDPLDASKVAYIRFASVFLYIREQGALIDLVSKTTEKLSQQQNHTITVGMP